MPSVFYIHEVKLFIPTFMFLSKESANQCSRALKKSTLPKSFLLIPKESTSQFVEFEIVCNSAIEPDDLEEIMYGLKLLYKLICEQFIKPEYFNRYFK